MYGESYVSIGGVTQFVYARRFCSFSDFLKSVFVNETGIDVCVTIEGLKVIIYS